MNRKGIEKSLNSAQAQTERLLMARLAKALEANCEHQYGVAKLDDFTYDFGRDGVDTLHGSCKFTTKVNPGEVLESYIPLWFTSDIPFDGFVIAAELDRLFKRSNPDEWYARVRARETS